MLPADLMVWGKSRSGGSAGRPPQHSVTALAAYTSDHPAGRDASSNMRMNSPLPNNSPDPTPKNDKYTPHTLKAISALFSRSAYLILKIKVVLLWYWWRTCCRWTGGRLWSSVRKNLYLLSGTVRPRYHVSKWWNGGQEQKSGCRNMGEVTMVRNLRLSCDAALISVPSGRRHSAQDFNHSRCQPGASSEARLIAWTNLQSNDAICCSNARGGFGLPDWWDLQKGTSQGSCCLWIN